MKGTKIRWCDHTWNPMVGCTKVSPGCDNCYAETLTERFGGNAFPRGFEPTWKPQLLPKVRAWARTAPGRVFTNSLSDVMHESFTTEQIDAVFDTMLDVPEHDYLLLTKRPKRLARYLLGGDLAGRLHDAGSITTDLGKPLDLDDDGAGADDAGYLARRGLSRLPANVWLGTSIENDRYTWRADWLRTIPVPVRFLSVEPMLGPVPSLDLTGIAWVIVGGESGPGYRPLDLAWARDVRDRCVERDVAFYWKQDAAPRTEMGITLDGEVWEQFPLPHPRVRADATGLLDSPRTVGVYVDAD